MVEPILIDNDEEFIESLFSTSHTMDMARAICDVHERRSGNTVDNKTYEKVLEDVNSLAIYFNDTDIRLFFTQGFFGPPAHPRYEHPEYAIRLHKFKNGKNVYSNR